MDSVSLKWKCSTPLLRLDKGTAKVREFFAALCCLGLARSRERRTTLKKNSPFVSLTLKICGEER